MFNYSVFGYLIAYLSLAGGKNEWCDKCNLNFLNAEVQCFVEKVANLVLLFHNDLEDSIMC